MAISLEEIKAGVNEACGSLVVQTLAEAADPSAPVRGLSSGSVRLNMALSGKPLVGYGWGRIVEIFGPESSGKTTMCLHALAEAQRLDLPCGFIDAEYALDSVYAKALGVKVDKLLFSQPDFGEQAIDIAINMLRSGVKLIVVDSVAALTPKAEIEGDMESTQVGAQARMMSKAMRKLASIVSHAGALIMFTNQIRMKIGVMFGSPETVSGGNALKFFSSYRLDVRSPRGGATKEKSLSGEQLETGIDTNVKIVKNKAYIPYRTATVHIDYGKGIDRYDDLARFLADGKSVIWKEQSFKVSRFADLLREDKVLRKDVIAYLKTL